MRQQLTHKTHFVQCERKYRLCEARLSYEVMRDSELRRQLRYRSSLKLNCVQERWGFSTARLVICLHRVSANSLRGFVQAPLKGVEAAQVDAMFEISQVRGLPPALLTVKYCEGGFGLVCRLLKYKPEGNTSSLAAT